jgi:MFS family permease
VIFIGVTIWSFAAMACGAANGFVQLAVARFAVGAGEASLNPAAYSMISDGFPRRRLGTALSVFGTGVNVGGALALILGASLLAIIPPEGLLLPFLGQVAPWRLVFIVTGAPGILLALMIWSVREPARQQRLSAAPTNYAAALRFMTSRLRFFGGHFIGVSLLTAGGYGLGSWMASHLVRKFGLSVAEAGFLLAPALIIPGIIGVMVSGAITDRLYARGVRDAPLRVLMALAALQMLPIAVLGVADNLWLAGGAVVTYMLFSGAAGIAPAAIQMVTPNEYRGQVSATYLFCTHLLGFGLGPPLVGVLITYVYGEGPTVGLAIATVIVMLNPLSILLLWTALKAMRDALSFTDTRPATT